MVDSVIIEPSVLAADFTRLGSELIGVRNADFIHFDVMDGRFVPNLSFGPGLEQVCRRVTCVPLDVHLMVSNPDETVDWYIDAGASSVTVHFEACTHLHRMIKHLQHRNVKAGVALNPATPVGALVEILPYVDLVLIMTVNPGFGGQSLIEGSYAKLRRLRALCAEVGADPLVQVDGGVTRDNIEALAAAGADAFVAGSSVFGADDPAAEIEILRELGNRGLSQR